MSASSALFDAGKIRIWPGVQPAFAIASTILGLLACAVPLSAQVKPAEVKPADGSEQVALEKKLATHRKMAEYYYYRLQTIRYPLPYKTPFTSDREPRSKPWTITTFGPNNGEQSFETTGQPITNYPGEMRMYWSRIPDFHATDVRIWPNKDGWVAVVRFEGTTLDGEKVRAHEADVVYVDDEGKVIRIEWYNDRTEWIEQIWSKASGFSPDKVREFLSRPRGFHEMIDRALQRPDRKRGNDPLVE